MGYVRARGRAIIPTTARTCIVRHCGTTINRAHLACPRHWWMLPQDLRSAIQKAKPRTGPGLAAVTQAIQWYRENVTAPPDPS